MTPRILIIAGSDSGGGAGIQADIKTVTMLGGHAMTAVTAITAQNTLGVTAVHPIPAEMVLAQIDAVAGDIGVDAIKIGMIGSAETANRVADRLEGLDVPIVFDPVMVATSGSVLADDATIAAFGRLMRLSTVTTPNHSELEVLCNAPIKNELEQGWAAENVMLKTGCPAILATGGNWPGGRISSTSLDGEPYSYTTDNQLSDVLYEWASDYCQATSWNDERIDTRHDHGTGCTLASAIAVGLARGKKLSYTIAPARAFVRTALLSAPGFGAGNGPMGHWNAATGAMNLNQVTLPARDYAASVAFYRTLGLRQIVDTPPRYARFECPGGATLSIHPGEASCEALIYFESGALDEWVRQLTAAGVSFDSEPADQRWLWREARLRDPTGNQICLYEAGENRRFPPWRIQ